MKGVRHSVANGIPCVKHGCVVCCLETRMPLSSLDIRRIVRLGYRLECFAARTKEGWRLKNSSGRCVFLREEGCRIYPDRPEGCRLYPLVYDENSEKAVIDHLCPHGHEFEVQKNDVKRLKSLTEKTH